MELAGVYRSDGAVATTEIDGSRVLLNVQSGTYYGLNSVGSFVWEKLAEPVTVAALCALVEAEFEVNQDQCFHDIGSLLDSLLKEGLITRVDHVV